MTDNQAILAAIAALSQKLDRIALDIAVNMAATDRAVQVNDHTRDELRGLNEMLSAMQRQIHRLNGAVFHDDKGA